VNRDGIEDWEALWIMEDLALTAEQLGLDKDKEVADLMVQARALADIPDLVVKDLTHYTKDPDIILEHRKQVSEIILALQEKIGKQRAADYRQRHRSERKAFEQEALQRSIERAKSEME
jgi:hypothetical protein